jgi:hypothetical protein
VDVSAQFPTIGAILDDSRTTTAAWASRSPLNGRPHSSLQPRLMVLRFPSSPGRSPVVITIGSDNPFLNYQGETVNAGQISIIDLTGTNSVPEPAAMGVLGSGLAALVLLRKYVRG